MNPVDMLISIPGPVFLLSFVIFVIVCIIMGRWIAFRDGTEEYPLPDARALDFIEIASMRGGRSAAIQAAIFDLWQRNLLAFPDGSKKEIVSVESPEKPSPSIQAVIYSFFKDRRRVSDLFTNKETLESIDVYLGSAYHKLEIMRLMLNKNERLRIMVVFCIVSFLIFGTGLTKLYFGLKYGRPVAFLVILLFLSFLGIMTAFKPFKKRRASRLGIKYLDFLLHHFSWLKQAVSKGDDIPSFNPALFGVAIFGVTFIAGMELFSPFSSVFPSDYSGDSISGGSYDGSSDSGGGGCSDGGGGCGGCGGGD